MLHALKNNNNVLSICLWRSDAAASLNWQKNVFGKYSMTTIKMTGSDILTVFKSFFFPPLCCVTMGVLSLPDPINSSWVSLLRQTAQGFVWFIAAVNADLHEAAGKVFQSVFTQLWLKRESKVQSGDAFMCGKNINWCFLWRREVKYSPPSLWRSHRVGLNRRNRWIIIQKVKQQHIICSAGEQETIWCGESGWGRQRFRLKSLTLAALREGGGGGVKAVPIQPACFPQSIQIINLSALHCSVSFGICWMENLLVFFPCPFKEWECFLLLRSDDWNMVSAAAQHGAALPNCDMNRTHQQTWVSAKQWSFRGNSVKRIENVDTDSRTGSRFHG